MKKTLIERFIQSFRIAYYEQQGFIYDHGKDMYYKTRSGCHNGKVSQFAMFKGKKLKKPFGSLSKDDKEKVYYRYFCDTCGEQCTVVEMMK